MPRFFYHFQSGPCRLLDTEGLECRTAAEAVAHAYVLALKTSHASALPGRLHRSIEVTDQAGSMLFRLPFSSVVIDLSQPSRRTGHDEQGYASQHDVELRQGAIRSAKSTNRRAQWDLIQST